MFNMCNSLLSHVYIHKT